MDSKPTVSILDQSNFCLLLPSLPGNGNGDGVANAVARCVGNAYTPGSDRLGDDVILSGHFVKTPSELQITGRINSSALMLPFNSGVSRFVYDDTKLSSACYGFDRYAQIVETNSFCIRCCKTSGGDGDSFKSCWSVSEASTCRTAIKGNYGFGFSGEELQQLPSDSTGDDGLGSTTTATPTLPGDKTATSVAPFPVASSDSGSIVTSVGPTQATAVTAGSSDKNSPLGSMRMDLFILLVCLPALLVLCALVGLLVACLARSRRRKRESLASVEEPVKPATESAAPEGILAAPGRDSNCSGGKVSFSDQPADSKNPSISPMVPAVPPLQDSVNQRKGFFNRWSKNKASVASPTSPASHNSIELMPLDQPFLQAGINESVGMLSASSQERWSSDGKFQAVKGKASLKIARDASIGHASEIGQIQTALPNINQRSSSLRSPIGSVLAEEARRSASSSSLLKPGVKGSPGAAGAAAALTVKTRKYSEDGRRPNGMEQSEANRYSYSGYGYSPFAQPNDMPWQVSNHSYGMYGRQSQYGQEQQQQQFPTSPTDLTSSARLSTPSIRAHGVQRRLSVSQGSPQVVERESMNLQQQQYYQQQMYALGYYGYMQQRQSMSSIKPLSPSDNTPLALEIVQKQRSDRNSAMVLAQGPPNLNEPGYDPSMKNYQVQSFNFPPPPSNPPSANMIPSPGLVSDAIPAPQSQGYNAASWQNPWVPTSEDSDSVMTITKTGTTLSSQETIIKTTAKGTPTNRARSFYSERSAASEYEPMLASPVLEGEVRKSGEIRKSGDLRKSSDPGPESQQLPNLPVPQVAAKSTEVSQQVSSDTSGVVTKTSTTTNDVTQNVVTEKKTELVEVNSNVQKNSSSNTTKVAAMSVATVAGTAGVAAASTAVARKKSSHTSVERETSVKKDTSVQTPQIQAKAAHVKQAASGSVHFQDTAVSSIQVQEAALNSVHAHEASVKSPEVISPRPIKPVFYLADLDSGSSATEEKTSLASNIEKAAVKSTSTTFVSTSASTVATTSAKTVSKDVSRKLALKVSSSSPSVVPYVYFTTIIEEIIPADFFAKNPDSTKILEEVVDAQTVQKTASLKSYERATEQDYLTEQLYHDAMAQRESSIDSDYVQRPASNRDSIVSDKPWSTLMKYYARPDSTIVTENVATTEEKGMRRMSTMTSMTAMTAGSSLSADFYKGYIATDENIPDVPPLPAVEATSGSARAAVKRHGSILDVSNAQNEKTVTSTVSSATAITRQATTDVAVKNRIDTTSLASASNKTKRIDVPVTPTSPQGEGIVQGIFSSLYSIVGINSSAEKIESSSSTALQTSENATSTASTVSTVTSRKTMRSLTIKDNVKTAASNVAMTAASLPSPSAKRVVDVVTDAVASSQSKTVSSTENKEEKHQSWRASFINRLRRGRSSEKSNPSTDDEGSQRNSSHSRGTSIQSRVASSQPQAVVAEILPSDNFEAPVEDIDETALPPTVMAVAASPVASIGWLSPWKAEGRNISSDLDDDTSYPASSILDSSQTSPDVSDNDLKVGSGKASSVKSNNTSPSTATSDISAVSAFTSLSADQMSIKTKSLSRTRLEESIHGSISTNVLMKESSSAERILTRVETIETTLAETKSSSSQKSSNLEIVKESVGVVAKDKVSGRILEESILSDSSVAVEQPQSIVKVDEYQASSESTVSSAMEVEKSTKAIHVKEITGSQVAAASAIGTVAIASVAAVSAHAMSSSSKIQSTNSFTGNMDESITASSSLQKVSSSDGPITSVCKTNRDSNENATLSTSVSGVTYSKIENRTIINDEDLELEELEERSEEGADVPTELISMAVLRQNWDAMSDIDASSQNEAKSEAPSIVDSKTGSIAEDEMSDSEESQFVSSDSDYASESEVDSAHHSLEESIEDSVVQAVKIESTELSESTTLSSDAVAAIDDRLHVTNPSSSVKVVTKNEIQEHFDAVALESKDSVVRISESANDTRYVETSRLAVAETSDSDIYIFEDENDHVKNVKAAELRAQAMKKVISELQGKLHSVSQSQDNSLAPSEIISATSVPKIAEQKPQREVKTLKTSKDFTDALSFALMKNTRSSVPSATESSTTSFSATSQNAENVSSVEHVAQGRQENEESSSVGEKQTRKSTNMLTTVAVAATTAVATVTNMSTKAFGSSTAKKSAAALSKKYSAIDLVESELSKEEESLMTRRNITIASQRTSSMELHEKDHEAVSSRTSNVLSADDNSQSLKSTVAVKVSEVVPCSSSSSISGEGGLITSGHGAVASKCEISETVMQPLTALVNLSSSSSSKVLDDQTAVINYSSTTAEKVKATSPKTLPVFAATDVNLAKSVVASKASFQGSSAKTTLESLMLEVWEAREEVESSDIDSKEEAEVSITAQSVTATGVESLANVTGSNLLQSESESLSVANTKFINSRQDVKEVSKQSASSSIASRLSAVVDSRATALGTSMSSSFTSSKISSSSTSSSVSAKQMTRPATDANTSKSGELMVQVNDADLGKRVERLEIPSTVTKNPVESISSLQPTLNVELSAAAAARAAWLAKFPSAETKALSQTTSLETTETVVQDLFKESQNASMQSEKLDFKILNLATLAPAPATFHRQQSLLERRHLTTSQIDGASGRSSSIIGGTIVTPLSANSTSSSFETIVEVIEDPSIIKLESIEDPITYKSKDVQTAGEEFSKTSRSSQSESAESALETVITNTTTTTRMITTVTSSDGKVTKTSTVVEEKSDSTAEEQESTSDEEEASWRSSGEKSVEEWTSLDVVAWLHSIGLRSDIVESFKEREIDGKKLMSLTASNLTELGIVRSGLKRSILMNIRALSMS
ncbi:hypothetical protein HDU97_002565 [Phlyctochytrium planicorne]|nr:hypothetical protein HDU97_002565 [Phlyctochytrium planicorne]